MGADARWKDISALYAAALERPQPERRAFVADTCADDEALRRELESLLACHADAQWTLTAPAVQVLADALAEESASLAGRQLGAYRIDAPLASGGMGDVYRATDTRLHRAVALKILPLYLRTDADRRQRFEREAQAVAALRHPNICVLYDIGRADGIDFLVMELLEGETLAERLSRGPLPVGDALRYALDVADALVATHKQSIVHRDLKPGNIMLTPAGAKLLDFGLAKAEGVSLATLPDSGAGSTASTAAAGTLPYMTPEQLAGGEVDPRSDLFAFGAVLYEMLTGRRAFDGPDRPTIAAAICTGEIPPLPPPVVAAAPGLDAVLRMCLRKNRDERWTDASALADALRRFALQPPVPQPRARPRRLFATATVSSLFIAAAVIGAWQVRIGSVPIGSEDVRTLVGAGTATAAPAKDVELPAMAEPNAPPAGPRTAGTQSALTNGRPQFQLTFPTGPRVPDSATYANPALYTARKAEWLARIDARPFDRWVIEGAADFFALPEPAVARQLYEQGRALEPANPSWLERLARLHERNAPTDAVEAQLAMAALEQARALAPGGGGGLLLRLPMAAFHAGDLIAAQRYATELLAASNASPRIDGDAVHQAHIVLGRVAVLDGRMSDAASHLLDAARVPGSAVLNSFGPNMSLARDLLERGETAPVLEYFELCRTFWQSGRDRLDDWAVLVQGGRMPQFGGSLRY